MTVMYEDRRGWRYKVMSDSAGKFCLKYCKPKSETMGWRTCKSFQHRASREEAELELDAWAMSKGMAVVGRVS